MYRHTAERAGIARRDTFILGICVLLLAGAGLVTLLLSIGGDIGKFRGQLIALVLGAIFFTINFCTNLDMKIETRKMWVLAFLVITFVLCVMPFFRVFRKDYLADLEAAKVFRWIKIFGISFQPSELAKLFLPVYFAHIFAKSPDEHGGFSSTALPPLIVTVVFVAVIFFQKDYSTALFIGCNALLFFFVAGMKWRYLLGELVLFAVPSFLAVRFDPMRWGRVLSLFNPELDPTGVGYQRMASRQAIVSGGFLGKGIGQGTWDVPKVPEMHADFIFASFVSETGFLGVLLFFALFAAFAFFGYRAVVREGALFNQLLMFGLITMIVSQVLLNIVVTGGFLPTTGIPLPFFSHGGSSLVVTLAACGFIVNISRRGAQSLDANSFAAEARNVR